LGTEHKAGQEEVVVVVAAVDGSTALVTWGALMYVIRYVDSMTRQGHGLL